MLRVIVATSVHKRHDVRVFIKQCRSLVSAGNEVILVVQDGQKNEKTEGVTIIDIGEPPPSRLRRILFSPWKMYRYINNCPGDIIHFHDPELLPVGYFLKRNKRHVIYDSHEDFPRQLLSKHYIHPVTRRAISIIFEKLENFIAKRMDGIVCATPFICRRFSEIHSNAVDINNYPLLEEFQKNEGVSTRKTKSKSICYIGAITRERGISELVNALSLLKDIRLTMCGPFESQSYSDELKSLPGWKNVDYRGVVKRQEVADIMNSSFAGVVTFLPGPNHNDSQPNKMFEYMSAGLPLIASNFPLWREIIEKNDCGICVDPRSSMEIAEAVALLHKNPQRCLEMGRAGRKAVTSKYNWESEARKLSLLYRKILEQEK